MDNVPPIFLRRTAKIIYKPIRVLFNKCLEEGVCPNIWKFARIVPVHKGGSKEDVTNYRPISILPTIAKLLEGFIHSSLYFYIHNYILPQQHGFVLKRSTITNLMVYATALFENMDSNKQTDAVYTDFKKAFDRIDHKILLEKIAFNGIRGNLWRWFKSYITNRTQKVVINGHESDIVTVTSGIPQGSIIGPFLFIIYINDINECFKNCNFLLYADDLKMYRTIENIGDHLKFQEDLNRLTAYCDRNKLKLSIDKCKYISFSKKKSISCFNYSLCGTNLDRVHKIRDLGVTLDTKLTLETHIENICNRAYKMYGFVIRSSNDFKRPSTYIYLYKSLIRSQIEYAIPVWDPFYKKYSERLERVQKNFLRCMHFKCYHSKLSYSKLLQQYKLFNLKTRRIQLQIKLLYDFCNNKYDCIDIVDKLCYKVPVRSHTRACRIYKLFATPKSRTNAGKRAPLTRMTEAYNNYFNTLDIFGTNVISFRNSVLNLLREVNTTQYVHI